MRFAEFGLDLGKKRLDAGFICHICRLSDDRDRFINLGNVVDGEIEGFGRPSNKDDTGSTSLSPSSCDCLAQ